jgi:hypothetical protein
MFLTKNLGFYSFNHLVKLSEFEEYLDNFIPQNYVSEVFFTTGL